MRGWRGETEGRQNVEPAEKLSLRTVSCFIKLIKFSKFPSCHLKHPEYAHHPDQSKNFASTSNHKRVLRKSFCQICFIKGQWRKPWSPREEKQGSREGLQGGRWCWGVPSHFQFVVGYELVLFYKSIIAPSGKSTSLASKQTGWDILNKVFIVIHHHHRLILHCHLTNLPWRKPLSGGQWPSVRGFPVKTLDLWSQWWLRWRYRLPFVNMRHNGGVGDHQVLLIILVQLCQRTIGSKSCCSWCKPILMTKAPGIVVRIKTAVETSTKSREVKA